VSSQGGQQQHQHQHQHQQEKQQALLQEEARVLRDENEALRDMGVCCCYVCAVMCVCVYVCVFVHVCACVQTFAIQECTGGVCDSVCVRAHVCLFDCFECRGEAHELCVSVCVYFKC
jgi:hypothetical protein